MFKSDYLKDTQIVIVGAGAIGSVLTYRLAQAGAQVTTVERKYSGSGITGNSFAWINAYEKTPKHYAKLNAQSIRDHEELAEELNGSWVRVQGGLHWEHAERRRSGQEPARHRPAPARVGRSDGQGHARGGHARPGARPLDRSGPGG